jgi:hypothetical protein
MPTHPPSPIVEHRWHSLRLSANITGLQKKKDLLVFRAEED